MESDLVLLSRLQFAFTTMFHILFPTLTIGLGLFLVIVELLWLRTREEIYYRIYRFWVKIFAIHFGVGVVSGVVLEFEFGTNWARFSQAVGNVFSPLLAFEVMTAFFLEAGFLGIMLFGWKRVHRGVHFLATCLVSGGAILSAFWIMAANSWMQTPAGYRFVNGKFMVVNFWDAILNPSALIRTSHMVFASFETSAFAVAGISAVYLLFGRAVPLFRRSLGLALILAAVFAPLQIYLGDSNGREVFHNQPAKLAGIEGHWETNTEGGAAFSLVALPDMKEEQNLFDIRIPYGLSLLVTHSWNGKIRGLKDFPPQDRPFSPLIFWTFRVMVAIGFIFLLIMLWAAYLWKRKRLFLNPWFLLALVLVQPLGFLATELGWITAEVGRQPWVVYNLLRTPDGVSPIHAGNVVWSLILFLIVYAIIGGSYFYYVLKTLLNGPDLSSPIPPIQRLAGMKAIREMEERKE